MSPGHNKTAWNNSATLMPEVIDRDVGGRAFAVAPREAAAMLADVDGFGGSAGSGG